MDLLSIAALLTLGSAAGFTAGLFGVGGGMLIVPFMTMVLSRQHFPPEHIVKVAIATSLTTIAFTSISSVRAHHRRGCVHWHAVRGLVPGILLGSLAGAQLAGAVPGALLAGLCGVFLSISALRMLRHARPRAMRSLPGFGGLMAAGTGIGTLSALLGAGGGFLTVPFLTRRNVPIHGAVASSAACGFPIALAGSIGYIWAGQGAVLPAGHLGYVNLPALACIVVTSVFTAPLGARAAHALPTQTLKRGFAGLLLSLSTYMLIHAMTR